MKGEMNDNEHLRRLISYYPALSRLNEISLKPGKIAIAQTEGTIVIDDQEDTQASQSHLIVGCLESAKNKEIATLLSKIIKSAEKLSAHKIAIAFPEEIDSLTTRKLLEISLAGRRLIADIHTTRKQRLAYSQEHNTPRTRHMNDQVMLQPHPGKSFADILKGLKGNLNPQEIGINVTSIRTTNNGGVSVRFTETKTGAKQDFLDKVKEATGAEAKCVQKSSSVIINDIEAGAEVEDVLTALSNAPEGAKIFEDRRGSRTMIISVPVHAAKLANELKYFRLQWTRARIRELITPDFCGRCQRYGHPPKACTADKEPEKRCLNCGELGHTRAGCQNEVACFECKTKGHRGNTMACAYYRGLVHAIKRK